MCIKEKILKNKPLNSNDQAKILIFTLLTLPSVYILGIIPIIFLIFGFFMMKKNKDFSHIKTAVNLFSGYYWLVTILLLYNYLDSPSDYGFAIAFGITITYLILVRVLFLDPLESHSEWVEVNDIFSKNPKSVILPNIEKGVEILKIEKLKHYSVADELIKWTRLKEHGHISEQEFNDVRKKLLNQN